MARVTVPAFLRAVALRHSMGGFAVILAVVFAAGVVGYARTTHPGRD